MEEAGIENKEPDQLLIDEINEIINTDILDPTTSMNILINAIQVSFHGDHFNDMDRMLITKALECFKSHIDNGSDILINVR